MLNVPLLSQRDSRWSSIILGNNKLGSKYTIGNFGCLITCFSMYISKTPDQVNLSLKQNGGFTSDGGDFIWSKSTVLGLGQTYLSPRYTGPVTVQGLVKVKELLDQNLPIVCEVDFNPNTDGEEQHYVLLIGYEGDKIFAADPWVGEIINLDVYGGPQRAIIQFRAYDKALKPATAPVVSPTINDQTVLDTGEPYKLMEWQAIRSKLHEIPGLNDQVKVLNNFIAWAQQVYNLTTNTGLDEIKKEILNGEKYRDEYLSLINEIEKVTGQFQTDEARISALQNLKTDFATQIKKITGELSSCKEALSTKKILGTFSVLGYVFKVYKGGDL